MSKLTTNIGHVYNNVELDEIRKCQDDIVYFCKNYVYIAHPIEGVIKFEPRDYQIKTLHNYINNRFNILLNTRQSGVTTTMAAYILWYTIFNRDKTIVIAGRSLSDAHAVIDLVRFSFVNLPIWIKPNPLSDMWSIGQLGFDNGSSIHADAIRKNAMRDVDVDTIFVTNMSYTPKDIQDAFWETLHHVLSTTDAKCNINSGLNTEGDQFIKIWESACINPNSGFVPQFIDWDEVPNRGEEFKRLTIEYIGLPAWQHEYECTLIVGE